MMLKSLTYTLSDTCQPTGYTLLERYTIDNQRCTHIASKALKLTIQNIWKIFVFSNIKVYLCP